VSATANHLILSRVTLIQFMSYHADHDSDSTICSLRPRPHTHTHTHSHHTHTHTQTHTLTHMCVCVCVCVWAGIAQSMYRLVTGWTVRDRIPVGTRFSAHVQTGPGAHPASYTMGTGFFLGVKCGRGVALTTHPNLVPRLKKE